MAEPSKNTYVLTVVLHGVKKDTALSAASFIQNGLGLGVDFGTIDCVQVMTSHLKDFTDSNDLDSAASKNSA